MVTRKIVLKNWRDRNLLVPAPPTRGTDGSEVLSELDVFLARGGDDGAPRRPALRLRYVDAGLLYASWVWDHQPDAPRLTVLDPAGVAPALDRLARAIPSPLPGETGEAALARAIGSGDLMDPVRELEIAHELTLALIPFQLGLELNHLEARGLRPVLRVQPSPTTAQVPWELLGTNGADRMLDMMDVSTLLPASLRNDPSRRVSPWDPAGPVALVLDPAVPGFPAGSELGSVLGPVEPGTPLAQIAADLGDRARVPGAPHPEPSRGSAGGDPASVFRRDDAGRAWLAEALAGGIEPAASRLLYVGHVTSSTHALDARMHLADSAEVPGRAAPTGPHRPYSAADIALGAPGLAPLTAPNRVALIACDSGGDLRFSEPTGLMAAFAHRGAEYVTATRWTLPTEAGLRRFSPALRDRAEGIVADAVLAVNAAQDDPDPVAALGAWQRQQRERWTTTGDPRFSPLVWAALQTAWSPPPVDPGPEPGTRTGAPTRR